MQRAERVQTDSTANVELLQSNGKLIKSTLDRFIADSTLASQELARTESEVIGSLGLPLLERPSSSDREQLIRAEAMSDWARVAEQVHLLLQAIETISLDDSDDPAARRTLGTLTETLKATLREYDEVQSRLFRPATGRDPRPEE